MFDLQRLKVDKNLTQTEIADAIGVKQGYVSRILNGIHPLNDEYVRMLCEAFNVSALDYEILELDISTTGHNASSGKLIPFYDADAVAGYEYAATMEPARQVGMIEIGSILKDSEAGIRVYGNSMIPNYPAGCVIGTKLHTDSFIEPGRVYVVETRDNRYLKRLYYNDDKSGFHCISDNQMKYDDGPRKGKSYYQDFEIPADEVVRIHQVVGVIKRNIL